MNQRHRRQIDTIDRHIRQLERLKTLAGHAWHACELTLPDGYPGGGTERTSGGDTSRPTEGACIAIERRVESKLHRVPAVDDDGEPITRQVPVFDDEGRPVFDDDGKRVTRTEPVFEDEAQLVGMAAVERSLRVIDRAIAEAHTELSILAAPLTRKEAPPRFELAEDCKACGQTVHRAGEWRIVSGYCPPCYEAWRRIVRGWVGPGGPDRAAFERTRQRQSGDTVRVGVRDDGQGQHVELTRLGQSVALPPHLADEFSLLDADAQVAELARFHEAAVDWWEQQA